MDVPVYNMQGESVGTMSIDEASLGGEVNPSLIKQAYVRYHANRRQGSSRTKSRSQIKGSTRKIYKQKGTGRARHGNKKANLFKGGGCAHSKTRTHADYRQEMPRKMRRKANRNALLSKVIDGEIRVMDSLAFGEPRTKAFEAMLSALKIDRRALVALSADPQSSRNARLSGRNCSDATLIRSCELTCFEMLNHRYLVIERGELEAWLSGVSSQTDKRARHEAMGRRESA